VTAVALSLWLVPEGEVEDRYSALIASLAARLGTPAFVPHVSLLGGLAGPADEIAERVAELARSLPPIEVSLRAVDWRDEFYRCLFVAADPTPSLLSAHQRAAEALRAARGAPFEPHLSLVYGHLDPARKEAIRAEIGAEQPATFVARAVHLFRTEGDPTGWRRVARFPLGRSLLKETR